MDRSAASAESDLPQREIGDSAVWIASSAKTGGAVSNLRDGSDKTFWQSDGSLPHTVSISFLRRVPLAQLKLKMDYKTDESYTPAKITIYIGTGPTELREVRALEIPQVSGWVVVNLRDDHRYGVFFDDFHLNFMKTAVACKYVADCHSW